MFPARFAILFYGIYIIVPVEVVLMFFLDVPEWILHHLELFFAFPTALQLLDLSECREESEFQALHSSIQQHDRRTAKWSFLSWSRFLSSSSSIFASKVAIRGWK